MAGKRINESSNQKIWIAMHQPKQTAEDLIRERIRTGGESIVVDVDNLFETVTISDPAGQHEAIFMEGHGAEEFAAEVEEHYSNLPEGADLSRHDCEVYVALTYTENHWN